jgi:hypothetical protein
VLPPEGGNTFLTWDFVIMRPAEGVLG